MNIDEKVLETLHQYFPIAWEITGRTGDRPTIARAWSRCGKFVILAGCQIDPEFPEIENWRVDIRNAAGGTLVESENVMGLSLPDALCQVKQQWEFLTGEVRSLLTHQDLWAENWESVTTESGEEWYLDCGKWTDGDFKDPICPTDGFFMSLYDGQVVQLKAVNQYADGKYWLGEIQVDADDMDNLYFVEMDRYPGYVGMPPAPRQIFEVESDIKEAIAQIEALHPGLQVVTFPWCNSSLLKTVYVYVQDDLDDYRAIVYQINRRSPKLL